MDAKMSRFDEVVAGLLILKKYGQEICAAHDIIYAGGSASGVSTEDASALDALGWHIEEDCDSYARFV